jgi:prepilin-type N-terminal cleavage/methylation domain-containing protein
MCIKPAGKTNCAWTLVEMMVALAVFSICGLALMGLYIFGIKSMASMCNYSLLDQCNRQAMNQLTREIRQSTQVLGYSTNSITIQTGNSDGTPGPVVTYSFNGTSQTLMRQNLSDGTSQVLLNNCSLLSFKLFMRCPSNAVFGIFPVATANWSNTVKVLQLTWKTSMQVPSGPINSENIQTARVVIRKQQDI